MITKTCCGRRDDDRRWNDLIERQIPWLTPSEMKNTLKMMNAETEGSVVQLRTRLTSIASLKVEGQNHENV